MDDQTKERRFSHIKNKQRRRALFEKHRREKAKTKAALKKKAKKADPEESRPKPTARTLDNTREVDNTLVAPDDEEVLQDERTDELEWCFDRTAMPRVLVTTSHRPHTETLNFVEELCCCIPDCQFFPRKTNDLKKIIPKAIEHGFTAVLVVNEDRKKPNALLISQLPYGPTAHFKLTSFRPARAIRGHGRRTHHRPEVILNRFTTRLGLSVSRVLGALYPMNPDFQGRSVVTWHNQRDFIFFRHHRYIFKNSKKTGLQELGPRFTLKLRSLQRGMFDTKFGEYEWILKRHEMETSRRRFFL